MTLRMSISTVSWMLMGCAFLISTYGQQPSNWTEPFPPHKFSGNLYYVGSKDLASYLIATSDGHILINSSLEESVPLIRASIEKLGDAVLIAHQAPYHAYVSERESAFRAEWERQKAK